MEKVYALVLINETGTVHIFNAKRVMDTYSIGEIVIGEDISYDSKTDTVLYKNVFNENELRIKAAQLQNSGNYNVCGNCVRHFYANE